MIIIGPPFSGKSTLMRGLRDRLGYRQCVEYGLLAAELYPDDRVLLIGRWSDSDATPGTDRLLPEAAQWLSLLVSHARHLGLLDYTIVMDGHHLTTTELVQMLRNHTDHHLILLDVPEAVRKERRCHRTMGWLDNDGVAGKRGQIHQAGATEIPGGRKYRPGVLEDTGYWKRLGVRYDGLAATWEPTVWPNTSHADYQRNLYQLCCLTGIRRIDDRRV